MPDRQCLARDCTNIAVPGKQWCAFDLEAVNAGDPPPVGRGRQTVAGPRPDLSRAIVPAVTPPEVLQAVRELGAETPASTEQTWDEAFADAQRRAADSPLGYAFIEPQSLYGSTPVFPVYSVERAAELDAELDAAAAARTTETGLGVGGSVTRDPAEPRVITDLTIYEVSVVPSDWLPPDMAERQQITVTDAPAPVDHHGQHEELGEATRPPALTRQERAWRDDLLEQGYSPEFADRRARQWGAR